MKTRSHIGFRTLFCLLLTVVLCAAAGTRAYAAIGAAESPVFSLDTLRAFREPGVSRGTSPTFSLDTLRAFREPGVSRGSSATFSLDTSRMDRAWADSGTFSIREVGSLRRVEGTVYSSNGPLAGATVTVGDQQRLTQADGSYRFTALSSAEVLVEVACPNYYPASAAVSLPGNGSLVRRDFVLRRAEGVSGFAIIDVTSPACDASRHAFFLDGVSHSIAFTATVQLAGKTLQEVRFKTPGQTDTGTATTRSYNVGRDFGIGGKLMVQALATDGTETDWYEANFDVIPPPPAIAASLLSARREGGTVTYQFDGGVTAVLISEGVSAGEIDEDIPGFGGQAFLLGAGIELGGEVTSNGTARAWSVGGMPDISSRICGVSFDPEVGAELRWDYSLARRQWVPSGYFTVRVETGAVTPPHYVVVFVGPIPVPVYWRGGFEASMDATLGLLEWTNEPRYEADMRLEALARIILGIGVADVLAAEGELKGGPVMELQYPETPHLRNLYVHLEGTARIVVFGFTWSPGTLEYDWPEQPHAPRIAALDLPPSGEFELLERGYLSVGGRSLMEVGANVIQANVFPYSMPDLAPLSGGRIALAWVCDAGDARAAADRTAVKFAVWEGEDWGTGAIIEDDGTADYGPQVAALTSGSLVAAWQDSTQAFGEDVDMEVMLPHTEITVATYDAQADVWGDIATLTDNAYLDRTPRLATGGDKALLTWVSNQTNHYLGTTDEPNDLNFALYDGGAWTAPVQIEAGVPSVVKTALAYDGTNGTLVYSADTDDVFSTEDDRELFAFTFDGTDWEGPIRLTDNAVKDANPQVTYGSEGLLVMWYRDGSILYSTGSDLSEADIAAEPGASSGAADFRLAVGPNGQISVVWQDVSEELVDIWTAVYDPNLDAWSEPYQLTHDTSLERWVAMTYDSTGSLMAVYDRTAVDTETLSLGQTDLCCLRHEFSVDLAVAAKDVALSDVNPRPGEQVEITALIRNQGGLPAQNVQVAFYDGDHAGTGTAIGALQTIDGTLPGAGQAAVSTTWGVPPDGRNHTIYVVVDPDLLQDDGDRTNNTCSVAATLADLIVPEVRYQWLSEELCNVTVRAANRGSASADGPHVSLRRGGPNGELLTERELIGTLAVDGAHDWSYLWDLAGTEPIAGTIELWAEIDGPNAVPELSENNNTGSVSLRIERWNITGDVTGDCRVNILDLIAVRNRLNQDPASGENWQADVNNDGKINILDLITVRNNLNAKCIESAILHVGSGETYTTIQSAIDAANDGDMIIVRDGVYTGKGNRDVVFGGKQITVRSEKGPENCIVDAAATEQDQHRGFIFQNDETPDCVLDGLTIMNAVTQQKGAGVYCDHGACPTVRNCIIKGNVVLSGTGGGGGIMCESDASPVISGNVIADNSATFGGGIYAYGSSAAIVNNVIVRNTGHNYGGGLYLHSGSATITNCTIADNQAGGAGGVYFGVDSSVISNTIIWSNEADTAAVLIADVQARPTISYSDVSTDDVLARGESEVIWGDGNFEADPLFADWTAGDYHLRSASGRWSPPADEWVVDSATSPCIDVGDPASAFSKEPEPNGGRINIGAYGNSEEASKGE